MKTIKRLLSYMTYGKISFIIGFVLLILAMSADLTAPIIAQDLIDNVITPAAETSILNQTLMIQLLLTYGGLMIATAILRFISSLMLTKAANRIVKVIRDQAYEHLQKLPIRFFDDLPAGKVVARITNDTEVLRQQFYVTTIGNVLLNVVYLIGTYVAIVRLHRGIGIALLFILPLMTLWYRFYSKRATALSRSERELNSEMNAKINESVQGMTIIQSFQQEDKIRGEFQEVNDQWFETQRKYILLDSVAQFPLGALLRELALFFVALYFSTQFLNGVLGVSVGTLYVLVDYTTRIFMPIQMIIMQMSFVQQAIASGERVFELLDTEPESEPAEELSIEMGAVAFEHINFGYTEDKKVLKNINFTAQPGETVALVGHTGSGKSSIMNILFRFYDSKEGQVLIDGQNIQSYTRQSVRDKMGIVLQDPFLFTGTLLSNITLDDPKISRKRAKAALIEVGGASLLKQMKNGLDEKIVEKGSTLSSGQRQLISFARALAFDPKILILDEATSSIDTETEQIIQNAMEVLKTGRTTFIIAHRLSTIQHADQIIVLADGEIVEQGNHASLLKTNGIYSEMYYMQKEGIAPQTS